MSRRVLATATAATGGGSVRRHAYGSSGSLALHSTVAGASAACLRSLAGQPDSLERPAECLRLDTVVENREAGSSSERRYRVLNMWRLPPAAKKTVRMARGALFLTLPLPLPLCAHIGRIFLRCSSWHWSL